MGSSKQEAQERIRQMAERLSEIDGTFSWDHQERVALNYIEQQEARIAELEQRPAVPEGWRIERTDDGRITVQKKGVVGCVAAKAGERGIAEAALYHLADALLSAQPAEQRPTPAVQGEPVYLYRRLGLNDFVTCDFTRYTELSGKPNSFETKILYAAPQPAEQQPAPDVAGLVEALEEIAASRDSGRHDGLPEEGPALDDVEAWLVARAALAAHRKPSVAPCCGDPGDCWEPCGELGKSEAHVRVHSPDAAKMVPVPYELLCRLADEDWRTQVPDEWIPEMIGPDGSKGPATFTVGDLRAAADLVRAFEGGEA